MLYSVSVLLLVQCIAILGFPSESRDVAWEEWKLEHAKVYDASEELKYRKIWDEKLDFIEHHSNRVDVTFEVGLNAFSDRKRIGTNLRQINLVDSPDITPILHTVRDVPASWDWRQQGAISPVKDQGPSPENPEAIVAAECVESYRVIKEGKSLLVCSDVEVQECCLNGGLYNPLVFDCIHRIGGLCQNSTYSSRTGSCSNNTCAAVSEVSGGKKVPQDESLMQKAVLVNPLMAGIDASQSSFENYQGGVYDDPDCSKEQIDHVIQIVGYGTDGGQDYWIGKNSWGTSWGMNGYIHIIRNKNMCGIATLVSYPV